MSCRTEIATGAAKRPTVYGKTQTEVRAKLKEARQRLDAGAPVKDARMTLASWLEEWIGKALEASDRKRATKDLYAGMARSHMVPLLGGTTLDRLRRTGATYLSVEQAQQLLGALRDDRLESLYRLMLATGLRRGEALALHWRDVDLDAGLARVRWTLSRTSKGLEIGEPKTERSRRPCPPPVGRRDAGGAPDPPDDRAAGGGAGLDRLRSRVHH